MPPPSKSTRARRSGHRKYRQKIDVANAVIVGDRRRMDIVYCYRFPSRPDRVKIGFSTRGLARVEEQSTSFPEKPELLFVIHDRRAKQIEGSFHEALAHRQADVMGTEWFDASWSDLLAVSPSLRRAAGKGTLRRALQLATTLCLLLTSIALYAPLAWTQISLVDGAPLGLVATAWNLWWSSITAVDMKGFVVAHMAMVEASWEYPMAWPWKILPALAAVTPCCAPWILRRRQAH